MERSMQTNKTIKMLLGFLLFLLCFKFVFPISAEAQTISLGEYYYIASALNTDQVLDVRNGSHRDGANIQLYQKNGTDAQLFKIIKSADEGYYYIINKGSEKALDVQGGGTESGTNVQLYTQNGTQAQKWKLYSAYESDENVSIMAYCGKFLDVKGGCSDNGTNIWIYDGNNTLAQAFKLIPYVNTVYETVTLDFDDFESWQREIEEAQCRVTFGGHYAVNPSGNTYYTGKIITDMTVTSWKSIDVKIPLAGPGNSYKYETINFPSEIRFKLHTHSNDTKMWFDVTRLRFWQQCECGYRDEWEWEVPWPDLTENTDTQTTKSIIDSIKPFHQVLYTIKYN